MKTITSAILSLLFATVVLAALPASSAETVVNTRPATMASEFAVLRTRSIFLKGQQGIYDPFGREDSRPPRVPTTYIASSEPSASQQAVLVFNGASDADGQFAAFIEDTTDGKMTKVQIGDVLAQGKVTNITLDQLDFQSASGVTHVLIGQNLQGVATASTISLPASAGATTTPASGAGTGPAPSGSDGSDVLERMRRRRLQESGGK